MREELESVKAQLAAVTLQRDSSTAELVRLVFSVRETHSTEIAGMKEELGRLKSATQTADKDVPVVVDHFEVVTALVNHL